MIATVQRLTESAEDLRDRGVSGSRSLKSMTMISCAIMLGATYYFAAIVQTILHRLFGHHDRIHKVYEIHAKGHHGKYPPHRLMTDQWIESEQHTMWYYAIVFVPIAVLVAWCFGPWIFLAHVTSLLFAIWWHLYLHEQYHLKHSAWEFFRWFRKKRALHFIHHREVRTNYAIVEYWIDRILGTRKDPPAKN